jgi:hypothetical protein
MCTPSSYKDSVRSLLNSCGSTTDIETHPQLALVGWYTFGVGPEQWHARLHTQLRNSFNCEPAIFLLYHPNKVEASSNGKLPFTIYENISVKESGSMDVDYPDDSHSMKFRPVTFAIETAPAEAIALADIAQGATNAATQQDKTSKDKSSKSRSPNVKKGKGKELPKDIENDVAAAVDYLTPEEETCASNVPFSLLFVDCSVITVLLLNLVNSGSIPTNKSKCNNGT